MNAHGAAITLCIAAAAGVFLIALASRLRLPSITLLLLGGILLGPEVLGVVHPHTLGDGLETVVTLAVAVVLFEGGLTLDIAGFRRESKVIVRMLTIGVLITWVGTSLALKLAMPWLKLDLAIIAGSLVIVTGPTVVSPLLRRIRVQPRLHHVLYWEGVVVDAVGVFVAVLCFEWIAAGADESALIPLGRFASRFVVGVGVGAGVGFLLSEALNRRWIAADHTNIVVLASALLALGVANTVLTESGILAVIVAGLTVSLRSRAQLKALKRFKLELTEVGIGLLFVLLAARLDLSAFPRAGAGLLLVLAVVLFVLRPLNVLVSTWGAKFSWQEKAFLSWLAPRGIVAASMASLFAIRLKRLGHPDADLLETLTYAVIGTTVVLQGLSSPFVARVLGLERKSRATWLVIGDPWIATRLHRTLRQCGAPTLVFGTSGGGGEGTGESHDEDPLDPDSLNDPRVADAEAVLAVSADPETNDRICAAWADVVGSAACYRWDDSDVGQRELGRRLWSEAPGPGEVKAQAEAGLVAIDAVDVGTSDETTRFGPALRPLLGIDEGHISIVEQEATAEAQSMIVLRQRIQGLHGLMHDALILDKHEVSFDEVLEQLLELATKAIPDLDVERHRAEILERERSMPTAIGAGICIPHVYQGSAQRSMAFVALVPGGLEHRGPDGEAVRLVFLVVSPADHATAHLRSLSAIAQLGRDRGLVSALMHQRTRGRLLTLLRERE
ncbi:MAG: cation:proton antiporter [Myxococcales bacterium]|nr:cation:proton antiporter [Myxococcales bacterium]